MRKLRVTCFHGAEKVGEVEVQVEVAQIRMIFYVSVFCFVERSQRQRKRQCLFVLLNSNSSFVWVSVRHVPGRGIHYSAVYVLLDQVWSVTTFYVLLIRVDDRITLFIFLLIIFIECLHSCHTLFLCYTFHGIAVCRMPKKILLFSNLWGKVQFISLMYPEYYLAFNWVIFSDIYLDNLINYVTMLFDIMDK